MKLKLVVGLVFAALGYAIVAVIGFQYLTFHVTPTPLLQWLSPVTIIWATEGEPPWAFLLSTIAPMNAVLYGVIAVALTSVMQHFSRRDERQGSAHRE